VTEELPATAPDLAYYEAVPYLLVVESIEKLEQARLSLLRRLWDLGAPIPVPRPPLQGGRRS